MKAIILAAGEGTRMRPLTHNRPKVMLPLANKPILEHLLIETSEAGIKDFIFVVGYRDEQIRNYFGNGERWQVNITYVTQRKQLGTTDAVKMIEGQVKGNFLMMNGDIIVRHQDIQSLLAKDVITMGVFTVEDTSELGVVTIDNGEITHIYEKMKNPPSHTANAGVYLLTPDIFSAIPQTVKSLRGEYEITDTLQLLLEQGYHLSCHELGYWLDLSYPWNLLDANETMLEMLEADSFGEIEDNVIIKGKVSIGQGSVIRAGSYIIGPVIIGQNCDIGPNCYIRPATAIGNNCHIGSAVEVKNSIVMQSSKIPHHNYVGDSVIGEGCNLGAGTKIANLRLDKKNVTAAGTDTGRRKLGAIIGDDVEIGINTSINVGCIIGNKTCIGPGATVSGVFLPGSRVL
ncbi:bifunctional sugar-1-phosphate nucleotidylyltransferase/acetyltransferase [Chloroflexota bacterium]